jgi:hypothetical protein
LPRFSRPKLVGARGRHLAGEFLVHEPLPYNLTHGQIKAVAVVQRVFLRGAIVVTEGLLINVAEQVERLDTHIRSVDPALEQAPKVFQPVGI